MIDFKLLSPLYQLTGYKASLVALSMLLQEVGEEEQLQYHKDNEEFYQYYRPESPSECHRTKTIIIKVIHLVKKVFLLHRRSKIGDKYTAFLPILQIKMYKTAKMVEKLVNIIKLNKVKTPEEAIFFVISLKRSTFAAFLERNDMSKKVIIPIIVVMLALVGGLVWLFLSLEEQKQVNRDMQELAALDKQEMENEYERFALQYSEMKTQINNDSIIAQLTEEQMKTQKLLEELRQVKASDAREIARLKKELATVRAVLRDYVMQIDSLNRLNESLKEENSRVTQELEQRNAQVAGLSSEKASLSEKVAIAAQLDATNIQMQMLDKHGKMAKKLKDCKQLKVNFSISKNVTASNGNRTIYVRIQNPGGNVLGGGGTFPYENKNLECSMKKIIEYTGEETPVATFWNVTQMLQAGDYRVSIFADGNMIGSRTFSLK